MDLTDVRARLIDAVPLEVLARIEKKLMRTLVAELHNPLAALDALPKEIVPAVREAFFAQVSALLMTACVNAFDHARQNIESRAAETLAAGSGKPRAVADADDNKRAADGAKHADGPMEIASRNRIRALESENARLHEEVQQAHRKIETLGEEISTLKSENARLHEEVQQVHRKIEAQEEEIRTLKKERDKLQTMVDFEPQFNNVKRDNDLTVAVNSKLLERAIAVAKSRDLSLNSYVSRALVLADADAERYIGKQMPFSEDDAKLASPQRE